MTENNDMKHVALSHVFNAVILYFTFTYLKAELICHILIKEGTFLSKYANYNNLFMKHAMQLCLQAS